MSEFGNMDIGSVLRGIKNTAIEAPKFRTPDTRSRAERREDFEKELEQLDRNALESLKQRVFEAESPDALFSLKDDVENYLVKFVRFYDRFEKFSLDEERKVELKKKELQLEARHDWSNKFRLFLFRILASALFIVTLFTIGYIEHEYDWARLPMAKYLRAAPPIP